MRMFFTSGTTGNPKMAAHKHTYALGHFVTAKYWHCVNPEGVHFTISDTGWAKAAWGKIYGQWLCETGLFVYDFDRFDENDLLPMFAKYNITTFCAPPTMLRMMIKEDISKNGMYKSFVKIKYSDFSVTTIERSFSELKFENFLKMTYNYYSELEPCSLKNTKGGEEYGINSNP